MKDLLSQTIKEVTFDLKSIEELNQISSFLKKSGETSINIILHENNKNYNFCLKNKRNLDRKSINLIRNKDISTIIG